MRKITYLFSIVFLFSCLSSCSFFDDEKTAPWAILVYMAADNGLSEAAIADINEMEKGAGKTKIFVEVDFDQSYGASRRYSLKNDASDEIKSPVVEYLGETDSGDGSTLANFVNWGMGKVKAEHYLLVIWSHGNGWLPKKNRAFGFCSDDTNNSYIGIGEGEFIGALAKIKKPLAVLAFDACLMQSAEVLGECKGKVQYVVGSEDLFSTRGFAYEQIISRFSDSSPEEESRKLALSTVNSYEIGGEQNPENLPVATAMSVVDMSNIDNLYSSLGAFARLSFNDEQLKQLRKIDCPGSNDWLGNSDRDLKIYFKQVKNIAGLETSAQNILEQLDNTAIFTYRTRNCTPDFGAMSIFIPENDYWYSAFVQEQYAHLYFSRYGWQNYIVRLLGGK